MEFVDAIFPPTQTQVDASRSQTQVDLVKSFPWPPLVALSRVAGLCGLWRPFGAASKETQSRPKISKNEPNNSKETQSRTKISKTPDRKISSRAF